MKSYVIEGKLFGQSVCHIGGVTGFVLPGVAFVPLGYRYGSGYWDLLARARYMPHVERIKFIFTESSER
jgi:hypothetical protein